MDVKSCITLGPRTEEHQQHILAWDYTSDALAIYKKSIRQIWMQKTLSLVSFVFQTVSN